MMVEGEATHEPAAPQGVQASPPEEQLVASEGAATGQDTATETVAEDESSVPGAAAEPPAAGAPPARQRDWSHLRGFQTVEAPGDEEADYADQLVKELQARAARFAQSVDESIVLSSEGLIRWLGDPVARVVAGEVLLKPHGVLLADEALTGEDREKVDARVRLWIEAHVRKVLGPLLALSEGADLSEAGRTLGAKIAEALGVLERERVRTEVKTLDQSARGALRKHGVRFGSQYIYVPLLLKPGARGLCSLLWTLRRGAETGADRLLAFAAAGRTSFANEGLLSPDAYRVAGFRLCGERVVRVDIIERLSDLIRAAIPDHMRLGSRPPSEAYGFVVTPQMTSLTGCSGEAFASILRSLGFEPTTVSKAAYDAAHVKAPTEPVKPAVAGDNAGPAEDPSEGDTAPGEAAPEPTAEEDAHPEGEPAVAAVAAAEVEPPVDASDEASAPEAISVVEDLPPVKTTASEAFVEAEALPFDAPVEGEASAQETVQETVEVWRPAARRPRAPQRPHAEARDARPPHQGKPRDGRRHGRPQDPANQDPAKPAQAAPAEAAQAHVREVRSPRDEASRRFEPKSKGGGEGRPNDDRRPAKDFGPRREQRPAKVDPDSPFAKLAALKPLLERRDKRT